ncbi:MAG: hypothetical protein AAFR55_03920, partial [Pseudomonadota bacterium]
MSETPQGVARLRELLFDRETALIETVDQRVDGLADRLRSVEAETAEEQHARLKMLRQIETLFDRAGTEERFRSSIASVLDQALTEAEITRQPELSRAIAPLVVSTIKTELRNSQDEMVEALYPITGRLVQSYVASAMKDLADQINRRLEQNAVMLRLRSWTTGRPVSDLAMADTQRLELQELYLIRRGSGELLARWPEGRELSNSDIHMSGLMTAITSFATEAFDDDEAELRSFERDNARFYLRQSPTYLIAAKCTGHAPAAVSRIIDDAFVDLLAAPTFREDVATSATPEGEAHLVRMAETIGDDVDQSYEELQAASTDYGLLRLLLFVIAVPLFAWIGWSVFTNLEEARVRNLATTAIKATSGLTGYRTELDVGYRGQTVFVTGLAPTEDVRRDLVERLRRNLPPTTKLNTELGVLPRGTPDARPAVERLGQQLAVVEAEVKRAALQRSLVRSQARLSQALRDADNLSGDIDDAARQTAVTAAQNTARRARDQLGGLTARVAGLRKNVSLPEIDALLETIVDLTRQVQVAIAALPTGDDDAARAETAANATAAPSDSTVASEDLSAEVERFASTVTALRQIARIKPVTPQTIVKVERVEPTVTADQRLRAWVSRNAVFFTNGTDVRAPDAVDTAL